MSRVVFGLLLWSVLPCLVEAQSMQDAAAQLAARISSLLQRRATVLLDSGSQLLILTASKVSINRLAEGKWISSSQAALALAKPLARDPRGRIQNTADTFRIFVPGTTCLGVLQPSIKLTCSSANETWIANPRDPELAVRWVTDRNFLESDGFRGTFFTVGSGVFAGTNGRSHDRAGDVLAGAVD